MKKMAMVVLCVMMLSMVAFGNEAAATTLNPDWYNCTIQSAGGAGPFYFVFATCAGAGGTFSWTDSRVYLIDNGPTTQGKAMLAAVLTAYASGGTAALAIPGFNSVTTGPPAGSFISAVGTGSAL